MTDLYEAAAPLYDAAFSWDVGEEVGWLLERMGKDVRSVLEPACGSGRMFPAFVRRGVHVVGVDRSRTMLERTSRRMARLGLPAQTTVEADMSDFDLGRTFDGAICPINSFCHLKTRAQALAHLACVARHLDAGRVYLVQIDLKNDRSGGGNVWEGERDGIRVRTSWAPGNYDSESGLETQVTRFEVLSGLRKGTVEEYATVMRVWSWDEWKALIDESPFHQRAAHDGNKADRPALPVGPGLNQAPLVWHELAV